MFGFDFHFLLIPPPFDLLLAGLLPFVIAGLALPDTFMMPKNDEGEFFGGKDEDERSVKQRWSDHDLY